jgi:hypothetical protein
MAIIINFPNQHDRFLRQMEDTVRDIVKTSLGQTQASQEAAVQALRMALDAIPSQTFNLQIALSYEDWPPLPKDQQQAIIEDIRCQISAQLTEQVERAYQAFLIPLITANLRFLTAN